MLKYSENNKLAESTGKCTNTEKHLWTNACAIIMKKDSKRRKCMNYYDISDRKEQGGKQGGFL